MRCNKRILRRRSKGGSTGDAAATSEAYARPHGSGMSIEVGLGLVSAAPTLTPYLFASMASRFFTMHSCPTQEARQIVADANAEATRGTIDDQVSTTSLPPFPQNLVKEGGIVDYQVWISRRSDLLGRLVGSWSFSYSS